MMDVLKGTVTPKDWMAVGVILGVTLLLCAVFYFMVFQGQVDKLDTRKATLRQQEQQLTQARQLAKDIDALRQETAKIQQLVDEFEKRLPSQREIAALLTQFERIANEVGVDVELESKRRTRDTRKETIPYGIKARGTFHQIASFINRLERFERYLKVSDIKVGKEEARVCEATFTLSTFTFIQGTAGDAS